ncbi:MAG: ABC transporter permease, partial [Clostridiales bacterium]|nr:ABC transporter permease [Clostridiales bacterium]
MNKKKLHPGTLALRNLKRHKRQYAAMVTGIILALVFASGFLYFFYCYRASAEILRNEEYGLEDCIIMHTNEEAIKQLQSQDMIEKNGLAHILGYLYAGEEFKTNGATVAWLDDEAKELANPTLLAGAWPEKDGEIAIEQTAMAQMGLKAEVGDTITLTMQPQNGEALLDTTVQKEYVLTGILKDKRANITESYIGNERRDLPAAFVCPGTPAEPGGLETLACYAVRSETGKQDVASGGIMGAFAYLSDPLTQYFDNKADSYVIFLLSDDPIQDISTSFTMIAILAGLLLLAACAAIINAFNNNLQARKRQIGMLRAVGATKGQIIKMYGVEALVITLICVPVSLLIAFLAVRAIIALLGSGFTFVPNLWVLLLCGVCGAAFVLIAATIPLIAATRISPMQAIRNISATRKMKTKRIRTQKAFRLPKLLAARRTTFGKGRQVVVSIFLAIAIITSGYVFSYITYMNTNPPSEPYDYTLWQRTILTYTDQVNIREYMNGFTESDRQAVLRSPYMKSSTGFKRCYVNTHIDQFTDYLRMSASDLFTDSAMTGHTDDVTGENWRSVLWGGSGEPEDESYAQYKPYMQGSNYIPTMIVAADAETLETLTPYLDSGQIRAERLDAGQEVILLAPDELGVYAYRQEGETDVLLYQNTSDPPITEDTQCIATARRDSDLAPGKELDLTFLYTDYDPSSQPGYDGDISNMLASMDVNDRHTSIGAVLSGMPQENALYAQIYSYLFNENSIVLLTSIDGLTNLAGNVPYSEIDFVLNQPCDDEIDTSVQSILNEITMRVPDSMATSTYETDQENKSNVLFLLSILLGAVILVLFFCGAIVNNTITADIRENRRELGTLRAVGASAKELSQAYILQLFKMLG